MANFHVPLIIRGRIIDDADVEFGGRRGGTAFTTPDVAKYADALALTTPSSLADLYDLTFDDIVDYLATLGEKLRFDSNEYLRKSYELSSLTSGLTDGILRHTYETIGAIFSPAFVREYTDNQIGIDYLEGWQSRKMGNGATASIRAFGARAVHVIAGNVPSTAAMSVLRNAITRSDAIFKTPSNDPMTAAAIARTMVEMAPDHPITKHLSVAYWKGGEEAIESRLYQPRNIEKIVAWGGLASITHIAKYVQPGIDLITLDPKLSSSIIGKGAFEDEAMMAEAAERAAIDIGFWNQEGCLNARVLYIQTGTDEVGLATANRFAAMVHAHIKALPPHISGPAKAIDAGLADELEALRYDDEFYKLHGGGKDGGIIVSLNGEQVDFARLLAHRIANFVPIDDLQTAVRSVNAYTQTIGIYPEDLKEQLRDQLTFHGAQRYVSLGYAPRMSQAGPHDGMEPLRRMVKWIIDERYLPAETPLASREAPKAVVGDTSIAA
jgi:hypothetical protein